MQEDNRQEKYTMEIALPRLIDTLGGRLYSQQDVAIRELIVNANDALTIAKSDNVPDADLYIRVIPKINEGILTIQDFGSGLTADEVRQNLSTIGRSGTAEMRDQLANRPDLAKQLIGTFGLGLLSAFVIADKVVIETKSRRVPGPAVRWTCTGEVTYTLEKCDKSSFGTEIHLHLKMASSKFAVERDLIPIIKRYADFLPYPIYFGPAGKHPINAMNAPWHRENAVPTEYETYVVDRYCKDGRDSIPKPLAIFPIRVTQDEDYPNIEVYGVLFVPMSVMPMKTEAGFVDLYVQRAFVRSEAKEILPPWARFVRGLIDSPSLELTLDREEVVRNDQLVKLRKVLGRKLSEEMARLAVEDEKKFREIALRHNYLIKTAAVDDEMFFKKVSGYVPFATSHTDAQTNLQEYLNRAERKGQEKRIFYHRGGESPSQIRSIFAERDLEVLEAQNDMDQTFLSLYGEMNKIQVEELQTGASQLFQDPESPDHWEKLVKAYREQINPPVTAKAVRFQPMHIPAIVVRGEEKKGKEELKMLLQALSAHGVSAEELRDLNRLVSDQDPRGGLHDGILYLNTDNSAIKSLNFHLHDNERVTFAAMHEIYHNARIFSQEPMDAGMIKHVYETSNDLIERLLELVGRLKGLEVEKLSLQEDRDRLQRQIEHSRGI